MAQDVAIKPTTADVKLYDYITIPHAAKLLGLSPRVLRAARDTGALVVYRLGKRWERTTLVNCHAWIRSQRVVAARKERSGGVELGGRP